MVNKSCRSKHPRYRLRARLETVSSWFERAICLVRVNDHSVSLSLFPSSLSPFPSLLSSLSLYLSLSLPTLFPSLYLILSALSPLPSLSPPLSLSLSLSPLLFFPILPRFFPYSCITTIPFLSMTILYPIPHLYYEFLVVFQLYADNSHQYHYNESKFLGSSPALSLFCHSNLILNTLPN